MVVAGLREVVQGFHVRDFLETACQPRSSFSCFPDEPRKMRGLSIHPPDTRSVRRPWRIPMRPNDAETRKARSTTATCSIPSATLQAIS